MIIRKVIRYNITVRKSVTIMKVIYSHLSEKEENSYSMLESLKEKVYRNIPTRERIAIASQM